ncbi:Ak5, partial [Symbiodinium sp. KB8]
ALDQAFAFEQSVGAPTRVISVEGSEEALKKSWTAQGASEAAVQKQAEIYREHTQAVSPCRGRVTNKCAPYAILVLCPGPRQVVDFYSKVGCARRVNYEASEDALYAKLKDLFLPETVFVLGGPGAGKTSQCKQLAEDLGYIHLSTGDLLRAEVAAGTSLGRQVQATLRRGDLVPNDTIMQLLKNAISKRPLGRFLLDGYPRTADQAREFTQAVGPATCVLHFSAPDDTLRRRVLRRGQTSGRRDDNVEAFNRQLRVYKNATAGVLTLYRQSGLVREIDASGSVAWVSKLAHAALRPRVVFVLGGPGVGKGTQCARIARDYGYVHLSAGDLLRAEIARGSPEGKEINAAIKDSRIVPVRTTLRLLKHAMWAVGGDRFLVDGFPRAIDNAEAWEAELGEPEGVLYFHAPVEVLQQRLAGRSETSQRVDDNPDTIAKRFTTFEEVTFPVIKHYAKSGKVWQVDASGSADEVYELTKKFFTPNAVFILGGPGSGKGTQAERIVKEFGYTHLSIGDLLRGEVARGSPEGERLSALMSEGKIIDQDTVMRLLQRAMRASGGNRFLIDGFPRALDQAESYERLLGDPQMVLFFDAPDDVLR